jgi:hypothetical protein
MKTLGLLLCCFFSILSSQTLAQNVPELPPQLNKGSSLSEIVDWLDKNSFSHARIGLESDGPESYTDHDSVRLPAMLCSRSPESQ